MSTITVTNLDAGGTVKISVAPSAIDQAHRDADPAHAASAVSIVDAGGHYAGTEVEAALQELGTPTPFFIDAGRMTTGDGAPSYTVAGNLSVVTLDGATFESVVVNVARRELPANWTTVNVTAVYAPNGSESAKDIVLRCNTTPNDVGDDYAAGNVTGPNLTFAVGTSRETVESEIATGRGLPSTDNGVLGIKVRRQGDNAADTFTGDLWLYGVRIEKAS